ncbi:hypothetical protein ACWC9S_27175 [Streptomyces xiamenensis]
MAAPQRMGPPPQDDEEDDVTEVTRESLGLPPQAGAKKAASKKAAMTRRSWYLEAEVADRFADLVDDIHHETRIPRHRVISALLTEAVDQAPAVQRRLMRGQA